MTNTLKTDPISLRPRNDPPPRRVYTPGVQEEKVVRFGLPVSVSRTCDAGRLGANAELLVEELQIECETLWRMSALTFATVQRVARDQAGIVAGMLAALTRSLVAETDLAAETFRSSDHPSDAAPIVTDGMLRSFGEIVVVASESCRELLDIQTERLLTWMSTLRTISSWSEQTDADRNDEG